VRWLRKNNGLFSGVFAAAAGRSESSICSDS
jgi:hypothetical protein